MTNLKPVSKDEFYKRMNPLNVSPRIINDRYPYTSDWHLQSGTGREVIGRSVGRVEGGWDYFLAVTGAAA